MTNVLNISALQALSGPLNICWFGASTAAADNTAAIQAALNAAGAVSGGKVLIPFGTYNFASSLTVPNGVTVEGTGAGSSLVKTTFGDAFQNFNARNVTTAANITFRNFSITNSLWASSLPSLWSPGQTSITVGTTRRMSRYSTMILVASSVATGTTGAAEPIGRLCPGTDASHNVGSPITVTQTGTPSAHFIDVVITSTGATGTAQFEYQIDQGTFVTAQTTAASYGPITVGSTNFFLHFSGNYTSGVKYMTPFCYWSLTPGDVIVDGGVTWTITDPGKAFNFVSGASIVLDDVIINNWNVGLVADQAELLVIKGRTQFNSCQVGVWICNSTANQPTASYQLGAATNRISIEPGVNLNGAIGIVDDGGNDHERRGVNGNCGAFQGIFAGVNGLDIRGGEWEGSGTATPGYSNLALWKFNYRSFFDRFTDMGQQSILYGGGAVCVPAASTYFADFTNFDNASCAANVRIENAAVVSHGPTVFVGSGNINGCKFEATIPGAATTIFDSFPGAGALVESVDNSLASTGLLGVTMPVSGVYIPASGQIGNWHYATGTFTPTVTSGSYTIPLSILANPKLVCSSLNVSGPLTIVLGSNFGAGVIADFVMDFSAMTTNGNTIKLQNGSGTKDITSLLASKTLILVSCLTVNTVNAG